MRKNAVLKGFAIALVCLALIWVMGRYGWKLFGFGACGGSGIERVSVSEKQVEVTGFYAGSFPRGCVGYITEVRDGALFIGVRYDGLFGFFELGRFDAVIPVDQQIRRVFLKAGENEYLIWDAETDPAEAESGFFGR